MDNFVNINIFVKNAEKTLESVQMHGKTIQFKSVHLQGFTRLSCRIMTKYSLQIFSSGVQSLVVITSCFNFSEPGFNTAKVPLGSFDGGLDEK